MPKQLTYDFPISCTELRRWTPFFEFTKWLTIGRIGRSGAAVNHNTFHFSEAQGGMEINPPPERSKISNHQIEITNSPPPFLDTLWIHHGYCRPAVKRIGSPVSVEEWAVNAAHRLER
jgi:hypothetical protein